ncbi:RagB/SusD family nutrient uptake outer membrane protein [Gelidibacter japonicus]|uniref:RagB/SusD family nutrient uptake outer membrane protein n=1 Tax=Gelidibacter japonicus TaxID=1962232 RepID=UPI003A933BE9
MKNYNKLIVLLLLLASVGFNACQSDFLDELPTEDSDASSVTETTDNLFSIVNGIHRSLYIRYGSQGRSGEGALMLQMENLGEDYVNTARANGWFITTYQWNSHTSATNGDDLFPYRTYYRIIRNANTIIEGAEDAEGPEADKNAALGQALTYRAFAYFQLVQRYGKRYEAGAVNSQMGVPLRLNVGNEPLARASVEDVYKQINIDLDDAISALEGYKRPNKSHLDKSVAQGLKARVALVQGEYLIAAQYAAEAKAGYKLMNTTDYHDNFSDYTSDEWMWGSHIQEDQTDYFGNFGAYISRNYSSSNIRPNPKAINSTLYDMIPTTDVRKSLFDPTGKHLNLPPGVSLLSTHSLKPYTSQKFIAVGTGDSRMDVPYMRVSEMYLIEAEAKARLGDPTAADALREMAVVRDPAYATTNTSGQALIDEILIQRRWELWGEGFRFYDLKRLNQPLNRNGANHQASLAVIFDVPAGDNRWQWLIPQDALNANPLLEQNPL